MVVGLSVLLSASVIAVTPAILVSILTGRDPAAPGLLASPSWHARVLPLSLLSAYLVLSVLGFFAAPFAWPAVRLTNLIVYLVLAFSLLVAGYFTSTALTAREETVRTPLWQVILVAGAAAHVALLFPAAYVYTGNAPWDIVWALSDQAAAYAKFQRVLAEGMPFRTAVTIVRSLAGPVSVVLPALAILLWRQLPGWGKAVAITGIVASLAFSIYRGTDKEQFDAAFMQGAAVTVVVARHALWRGGIPKSRIFAATVVFVVAVGLLAVSFVERKSARVGFELDQERPFKLCITQSTCAETGSWTQFATAMIAAYMSQGYYGLALALDLPAKSQFGLGHSTVLTRGYVALTGDRSFPERAITTRLAEKGWDLNHQWATAYTWFANDVGFYGAAVVCGVVSLLWGLAWKDAVWGGSISGGTVFSLLSLFLLYLPASNQMLQNGDQYFALLLWLALWLGGGRKLAKVLFKAAPSTSVTGDAESPTHTT